MVERLRLEDYNEPEPEIKQKSLFGKFFQGKSVKKTDQVAVMYLRNNGVCEPMIVTPKAGFFNINGQVYHQRRDCKFTFGKEKMPMAIIPEWKLVPVGTKEYDEMPAENRLKELQGHVVNAIRQAELVRAGDLEGKKLNPRYVIIGIIVVIVLFALGKNYLHF